VPPRILANRDMVLLDDHGESSVGLVQLPLQPALCHLKGGVTHARD
jgi:hypothetical protein